MTNGRNLRDGAWSVLVLAVTLAGCSSGDIGETGKVKQALGPQLQLPGNVVPDVEVDQNRNVIREIRDDNNIPLNPMWGIQFNQKYGLVPDAGASPIPPDILQMCAFTDPTSDGFFSQTGCTDQSLYTNFKAVTVGAECHDAAFIGLKGHLNWVPVTLQGDLLWEGHEGGLFGDGDFNIQIFPTGPARNPLDNLLVSHEMADCNDVTGCSHTGVVGSSVYIKIEFKDAETVLRYHTPFWQAFQFPGWGVAQGMINSLPTTGKGFGIVTGPYGIDTVHADPLTPEVHPAWAFSALVSTGGANAAPIPECEGIGTGRFVTAKCAVDKWMSFVRGTGNEGDCGPLKVPLSFDPPQSTFKVRYPSFGPDDADVTVVATAREGSDSDEEILDNDGVVSFQPSQDHKSVLGTFDFANPPNPLATAADVAIVYGSARLFNMSRQLTSNGGWPDNQWFLAGDFTGDGIPDMAHAFDADNELLIDVYRNTGDSAGTLQSLARWTPNSFGHLEGVDGLAFLAADFTGDGADDIINFYRSGAGKTALVVIPALGPNPTAFEGAFNWTPTGGGSGWVDKHGFVVADFTGDRRPDVAYVFNNDGHVSIDMLENSPTALGPTAPGFLDQARWLDFGQGGGWVDKSYFLAGDFTGDGRPDIAHVYFDDSGEFEGWLINVYPFSPTARPGGNPGFLPLQPWLTTHLLSPQYESFVAADFTSDGRADIAHALALQFEPDKPFAPIKYRNVLDVLESSPTAGENGGPGFKGQSWAVAHGLWNGNTWLAGDFNHDCAPDAAAVFNTDDQVSQDLHPSLFVPSKKTVDFSYVPPNITTTICDNVAIGQARADRCNPVLSVSNNAPATFPIGQTPVVWTVADNQGQSKNVTQVITVVPGMDPSCYPPGTTVVKDVSPSNPNFDRDINPMNGIPDGWNPGGAGPTLVPGASGGRAVKLTATPQAPFVYLDAAAHPSISPPATAGLFLSVRVAVFTSGSLWNGSYEVNFTGAPGGFSRSVLGYPNQWKVLRFENPIPVNATGYGIRLRVNSQSGGTASVIFDDLQVTVVRHQ